MKLRSQQSALLLLSLVVWSAAHRSADSAVPIYAEGHADIGVTFSTVGGPHLTLHASFDSNVLSENSTNPREIANQTLTASAVAIRARNDNSPILRQQKISEEAMEVLYDRTTTSLSALVTTAPATRSDLRSLSKPIP